MFYSYCIHVYNEKSLYTCIDAHSSQYGGRPFYSSEYAVNYSSLVDAFSSSLIYFMLQEI